MPRPQMVIVCMKFMPPGHEKAPLHGPTPRWLRIHVVKGKFLTDGAGGSGGGAEGAAVMDEEVWSRLPEHLLWQVLLFLLAAKLFQLQLVSRKWRTQLTSPYFRNRFAAQVAAGAASRDPAEQRVVACVIRPFSSRSRTREPNMVDVDMTSFVPASFWKPDSTYSVKAAAHGLLCICNESYKQPEYCVINPLTRTFKLLPPRPFQPRLWVLPSPSAVTIYGDGAGKRKRLGKNFQMATYDLAAAGGGKGWVVTAHNPVLAKKRPRLSPVLAECGGETFYYDGRVHVMAPAAGSGPGGLLEEAAVLDVPSVNTLDLYSIRQSDCGYATRNAFVVAHRGAVFFVAHLFQKRNRCDGTDVACGVWRLARDRLEWEVVAALHDEELGVLTGLEYPCVEEMFGAYAAREFLCCSLEVNSIGDLDNIIVGLNLDTLQWEQLLPEWNPEMPLAAYQPMELRPDLFLS